MKGFLVIAVSVMLAVAISPLLWAQWPDYPTANVPLLPNGQPNMEGPTPRTPDGKPDLSGIWALGRGGGGGARGQRGQGRGGAAAGAAPGAPAAPAGAPAPAQA